MRTRRAWRWAWLLVLASCCRVCGLHAEYGADKPPAATPALQRTYDVLRNLAARTGQPPGSLLLITFANEAFQDLLINWVVHARRAGVGAFLVGAMDAGTHRFCSRHGLLSWPMDDPGLLDLIASSANTTELVKLADNNFRCAQQRMHSLPLRLAERPTSAVGIIQHFVPWVQRRLLLP